MEEFVYAGSEEGCGLASLRMMLIHYQREGGYAFYPFEERRYDLDSLSQLAEKEGLSLLWKRVKRKESLLENTRFPLLVLLREEGKAHLVYLKRKTKKGFLVYDPTFGKRVYSFEELLSLWEGVYGEGERKERKRFSGLYPRFFSLPFLLLCFALNLLSLGSLFVSFLFFKEGSSPFYPIGLLFLFALGLGASGLLYQRGMRSFDEKYLPRLAKRAKGGTLKGEFTHYQSFKSLLFGRFRLLLEGSLAFLSLLFLFGLNSVSFLYSALLYLLFFIVTLFLLKKPWQKEADLLGEKEGKTLEERSGKGKERVESLLALSKKSFGLGIRLSLDRFLELFVLSLLAFLPALLENRVELNFYLLSFFGLLSLNEALVALGKAIQSEGAYLRERAHFMAHLYREDK